MKASEEKIYRKVLESATKQVFTVSPEELESVAFPFWQKAIHDILVSNRYCQCVCHDHNISKCFLNINPRTQVILHSSGELSFEGFLETLETIKKLALMNSLPISAHT